MLPLPSNGMGLMTPPLLPAMLTPPALPLGGQPQLAPPPRFTALNPAPRDPPPPLLWQQPSSGSLGPAGPPPQALLPLPPAPLSVPGAPRAPVQAGPVAQPSRRVSIFGEGVGSWHRGGPLLAPLPALPAPGASAQVGPSVGSGWLPPPHPRGGAVSGEAMGPGLGVSSGGHADPRSGPYQPPHPPEHRGIVFGLGGGTSGGSLAPPSTALPSRTPWSSLPAPRAMATSRPPEGSGRFPPPPPQDSMVSGGAVGSWHGDTMGGPAGPPSGPNQLPPPPLRRDIFVGQGMGPVRGGAHAPLSPTPASLAPWSSLPAPGASTQVGPSVGSGWLPPPPPRGGAVSGEAMGPGLGVSSVGPADPRSGPYRPPHPPEHRGVVFGLGVGTRGGSLAPPSTALPSRTPWSSLPAPGAMATSRPPEGSGRFPPPPPQDSMVSGGAVGSLHRDSTGGPAGPPGGPNQLPSTPLRRDIVFGQGMGSVRGGARPPLSPTPAPLAPWPSLAALGASASSGPPLGSGRFPSPPQRSSIVFGEAVNSAHGGAAGVPMGPHSGSDRFPPPPPRGSVVSGDARWGGLPPAPAYSPPLVSGWAGPGRADAANSWRRDQPPTYPGRWGAGGSRPLPSRRRRRSPAGSDSDSDSVSSSSSYGSPERAPAPSTRPPPRKHARSDRAAAARPGERPGEAQ
jgi:hypothetical protein